MPSRLALGLIAMAALAACSTGVGPGVSTPSLPASPTAGAAAPSAGETSSASIDQAFIDMMVPHHQSAAEMAQLAQERAEHTELRELADDIIEAQEAEIAQMQAWRAEWFGSADTPPMEAMPLMPGMEMPDMDHDMGGSATMDMTADIETLRTAEPFDEAFLEKMTAHHRSAIEAAGIVLDQTGRPEISALAEEIIESQQAEIDQMETWLAEWYPDGS